MSTPFIGEIRMFGGNFAILGWAFCSGQLVPISQNDALFALIGTTYGGDGQQTFGLPDFRGRLPVHMGNLSGGGSYTIGQQAGSETVTLNANQLPAHQHPIPVNSNGSSSGNPAGNIIAKTPTSAFASGATTDVTLSPASLPAPSGGGQPHSNMMPYLCVTFIIAMEGIFPSRN